MKTYYVTLREDHALEQLVFPCEADDCAHAREQARDMYPRAIITDVSLAPQYILVYGDPVDGFYFRGPFASNESAVDFANTNDYGRDWWVAELNPVEE